MADWWCYSGGDIRYCDIHSLRGRIIISLSGGAVFPLPLPDRINTSISPSLTHTAQSCHQKQNYIFFLKNTTNDTLLEVKTKIFSFYTGSQFLFLDLDSRIIRNIIYLSLINKNKKKLLHCSRDFRKFVEGESFVFLCCCM